MPSDGPHTTNQREIGRLALAEWEKEIQENSYLKDGDFRHSVSYHLPSLRGRLDLELEAFAALILNEVEPLVQENSRPENLPRIATFDGIGNRVEKIIHHPSYTKAGNLIYSSRLMERMAKKGGLTEGLMFFFLSSQAGEAGHNCPIACSYGIIRVLQKYPAIPRRDFFLEKLIAPSFEGNYTGAQFVTEVQGGSDAGTNAAEAVIDAQGNWRVSGEKWFCSNANADLMLVTARYNPRVQGTKGLGLFLVPAVLESGERNSYKFRRLKEKFGTRTLATAEIDFEKALGFSIGEPEEGFKILMENVLHASRLFNTVTVLGMARRAYQIAHAYAKHRKAFGHPILEYPQILENLARIKAENTALTAGAFAALKLQDQYDLAASEDPDKKLLLRLLSNMLKSLSSLYTVKHIHQSLDILGGNGTIETFSPIPRLLSDSIICENWEGTHNVLRMQILKDIERYKIDELFFDILDPLLEKERPKSPFWKILQKMRKELGLALKELKESPPELKTLQIAEVVNSMGALFSAFHLLLESIDQECKGSSSKTHCLRYFLSLHGQKPENPSPAVRLEMILNVCGRLEY